MTASSLATFRAPTVSAQDNRPTTPYFFHTPPDQKSPDTLFNTTYYSIDERYQEETCRCHVQPPPSCHHIASLSSCDTRTPSTVMSRPAKTDSCGLSYAHLSSDSIATPKAVFRNKELAEMEVYVRQLRAANSLGRLTSIVMNRRQMAVGWLALYKHQFVVTQHELLATYLIQKRQLSLLFRRWRQLVERRSVAELRFLLRKSASENAALHARVSRAVRQQRDCDLLLRQQRKELRELKDAVWSVWQNELHFSDRRRTQLSVCVRELTAITNDLENDRKEKEPLLTIEYDDFFHRLIKHHKIRHLP